MRISGLVVALMLLASAPAAAEPPKAAVFDFELLADQKVAEEFRTGLLMAGNGLKVDQCFGQLVQLHGLLRLHRRLLRPGFDN